MIFGHEWLMLFTAILVLGVVVWFLWRRPRSFDIGAQLQAPDDAAHDPAGEPRPVGSRRRTP